MHHTVTHGRFTGRCIGDVLTLIILTNIIRAHIEVCAIRRRRTTGSGGTVTTEIVGAVIGSALLVQLTRFAIASRRLTRPTAAIKAGGAMLIHRAERAASRLVRTSQTSRARNRCPPHAAVTDTIACHRRSDRVPRTGWRGTLGSFGSITDDTSIAGAGVCLACILPDAGLAAAAVGTSAQIAIGGRGVTQPIAIGRLTQLVVKAVRTLKAARATVRSALILVIAVTDFTAAAFSRVAAKAILTVVGRALHIRRTTVPVFTFRGARLEVCAIKAELTIVAVDAGRRAGVFVGAQIPAGTRLRRATQSAQTQTIAAFAGGQHTAHTAHR